MDENKDSTELSLNENLCNKWGIAQPLVQTLLKEGYYSPWLKSFFTNSTVGITNWLTVTKYQYLKRTIIIPL
jgi:hypothetical protein